MLHACAARFDVTVNLKKIWELRPCLDALKNPKVYKILHHIESYGTYIEH